MTQTRPVSPIEFKDNLTEKMSSVSNTGYFQCVPNFTFARLRNFGRQLLKGPVKKEEGFFARSKTSADVSKNKHIKMDLACGPIHKDGDHSLIIKLNTDAKAVLKVVVFMLQLVDI
eukprot:g15822.t1